MNKVVFYISVVLMVVAGALFASQVSAQDTTDFKINSVSVAKVSNANLCSLLGGSGKQPVVTISHSRIAGQKIRVRMYDALSDGRIYEHRSKTVRSDASGQTVVNSGFLAPCNRTNGRVSSHYKFDVTAGKSKVTKSWAKYNSAKKRFY